MISVNVSSKKQDCIMSKRLHYEHKSNELKFNIPNCHNVSTVSKRWTEFFPRQSLVQSFTEFIIIRRKFFQNNTKNF